MVIYLFRDEGDGEVFAFSTERYWGKHSSGHAAHRVDFPGGLGDEKFPEPWDIDDFQPVLDHLKRDGYYLFAGELVEPLHKGKLRPPSPEC